MGMCMINGELGLKEISEYIENRMMNFWFQVETGEENKISTILYKWIKILHNKNIYNSPWIGKVERTLNHMRMSSLLDIIYAHIWSESVFNNSVCLNFRAMTVVKKKTK